MSRCSTTQHTTQLNVRAPISNIITHHAEDGSGIGSAIIAGEFYTLSHAGFILTSGPSDDEEEERRRTVPKLLIEQTHFPP